MNKNTTKPATLSARVVCFGSACLFALSVCMITPALAEMSDSIESVGQNISTVPVLINYASYVMGVVMGVTGLMKLKGHLDNPAQNSIYPGLGRLVAAAMFISLPYVLRMMQGTVDVGTLTTGGVTFTQIPVITS